MLCVILLVSVQGTMVHAQCAPMPTRMDIDRMVETVTNPAVERMTVRMRAALPDTGGDRHGKPGPLATAPVWAVPDGVSDANPPARARFLHGFLAPLRSGRGPPA